MTAMAIVVGLLCVGKFFQDSYKSKIYVARQCQVDSIDVRYHRRRDYRILWKVRMIDEFPTAHVLWISQGSASSESSAWNLAERYQVEFNLISLKT